METTLDVLKRIEKRINEELESTERQYYNAGSDHCRDTLVGEKFGLKIALIGIHEEMDKIIGLGSGGS